MSQWTHVLGAVTYKSHRLHSHPLFPSKDSPVWEEVSYLSSIWGQSLPEGSEGPLGVTPSIIERSILISIVGHLRDFGKEDLADILDWANHCSKQNELHMNVRDAFIWCDVESDDNKYIIEQNNPCNSFVLNTYKLNNKGK